MSPLEALQSSNMEAFYAAVRAELGARRGVDADVFWEWAALLSEVDDGVIADEVRGITEAIRGVVQDDRNVVEDIYAAIPRGDYGSYGNFDTRRKLYLALGHLVELDPQPYLREAWAEAILFAGLEDSAGAAMIWESTLEHAMKWAYFRASHRSLMWVDPEHTTKFKALLQQQRRVHPEQNFVDVLPFQRSSGQFNRTLFTLYFPEVMPLVEWLETDAMWESPAEFSSQVLRTICETFLRKNTEPCVVQYPELTLDAPSA